MKSLFRWLRQDSNTAAATEPQTVEPAPDAPPLTLIADTTMPIADWDAMDAHAPKTDDFEALDTFWTATARAWLSALRAKLGERYAIRESAQFLMLSPLDAKAASGVLAYAEKTKKRVLRVLDGIARDEGFGKVVVLVFDTHDEYYDYVSNYYPAEGEFALSGGMFLQRGYGHFVFVADEMWRVEPTIAHELTHSMVQHLPIPAWLNEGLAVNTEQRLAPPLSAPLYTPEEMHRKHLAFWNESTIQAFWSGKSWNRTDDGNMLSYDLARHFVRMAAKDFDAFRPFVNAANISDTGDAAARAHLGYPVAHLAEAVLGEGAWQPDPDTWHDGTERGESARH